MTSRRTFLVAGLAGGAALTLAWWWRGSDSVPVAETALQPLATLDAAASAIIAAIVPVVLDGALPATGVERRQAIEETVGNVARAVAGLPPASQRELGELFALLGFAPTRIGLARVGRPWPEASPADVAAFLDRWRQSGFALLRSAYDALHQIVFAAWYGNPRSWPAIGYGGPPRLLS
jgi:hypothetical protein